MAKDTTTGGRDATTAVIPGKYAFSIGDPRTETVDGFGWRPLADLARLESGHTPSRAKPEYWDGEIPWIGIRDATGNHGLTIHDTLQHVSQLGIDNSSARMLPAGTVCLSRTASVGYVVTMGVPMATSQDFVNWVCGPDLDHRYLHYLLMGEQESIQRVAYGSVHATMYYPDAKAVHVCVPDIHEQRVIADVLGVLDDKIAANTRLAATADALAREFFAASAAQSEETLLLEDLASNVREVVQPAGATGAYVGLEHAPRRRMWLGDIGDSGTVTSAKSRFQRGDVLFGKLRPYFHKVVSAPMDGVSSTDILVVRAADAKLEGFVLAAVTSDALVERAVAASEGTRMPRASWRDLASWPVPWPGRVAALELSDRVAALRDAVEARLRENVTLAATRDTLLPQLMSGKLRVREAAEMVGL